MKKKEYKIFLVVLIFLFLFSLAAFWYFYQSREVLVVNFFDVGQGDASLIEAPDGQNILIDGGPDNSILKKMAEALPWWERTIDLLILTHPHSDHVGGLNQVLKRYQVKKILYTGVAHDAPDYLTWLDLVKKNRIPLLIIDRPQTIRLGENCRLDIIYPRHSFAGLPVDNLNNTSLAAELDCLGTDFLFTGDAESEQEKELLSAGIDLSAKVLKAGHHGSNTSSSEEFLAAVLPEIVVISVGRNNDFGHPSLRTINRFKRVGASVHRTDENGSIAIMVDRLGLHFLP